MTDKDYTLIAILADGTGSMGELADGVTSKATIATNGIHDLVREHRGLPGKTEFQLAEFDWMPGAGTQLEKIAPGNGEKILLWRVTPGGNTPLYDAIGMTITELGDRLEKMPEGERPGRVFFVIATDGKENWSSEYNREQISKLIDQQHDVYGWDFVYIGAGFEDFDKEAAAVHIAAAATMSTTPVGMAAAYGASTHAMTRSRQTGQAFAYSDEERQDVEDAEKAGGITHTQNLWHSTGRSDRSKS